MQTCPRCKSAKLQRSRSRSKWEVWRKEITHKRPFRCADCGWLLTGALVALSGLWVSSRWRVLQFTVPTWHPLVIYSVVGLGKTHLLEGIGHALRQARPGLNVIQLTAEAFGPPAS